MSRTSYFLLVSASRDVMAGAADETRAARGLRSARRRESTDNRVYSRLMYYLWALVCRWSCARGRLQAQASTVTGKQRYSSVDKHVSDNASDSAAAESPTRAPAPPSDVHLLTITITVSVSDLYFITAGSSLHKQPLSIKSMAVEKVLFPLKMIVFQNCQRN